MSIVPRCHAARPPPPSRALHTRRNGGLSVSTARQIRRAKGERCQRHRIAMLSECGKVKSVASWLPGSELSSLPVRFCFLFFLAVASYATSLLSPPHLQIDSVQLLMSPLTQRAVSPGNHSQPPLNSPIRVATRGYCVALLPSGRKRYKVN